MNKKAKKIISIVVSCLIACIFILTLYVIISSIVASKNNSMSNLFGYTYSIVPTESMEPEIHVGDSIIGKKVKYDTLKIGDDIIYYNDEINIFVVHRIIRYEEGLGFKTKGINNLVEDELWVTSDNYQAKVVWHGNILNLGSFFLNNKSIIFVFLILALLLIIGNVLVEMVNANREMKKKELEQFENETKEEREARLRKEILEEMEREKALREEIRKEIEKERQEK